MNRTSNDFTDTLKCPITFEFFRDPVIGNDGHTYERENITTWIQKHGTSPITRETMTLSSLRPNFIVRKMIEDFASLSQQTQHHFRLNIDLCKTNTQPIFQSSNKTIYQAKWMQKQGPFIALIEIHGAKAKYEASFYIKLSDHPHIVRTYGLVDSNSMDSVLLAQEYASEGALNTLLREKNFRPTIDVILEIFRQILDAMIYLVDNQIIHGDLACRNILVFRLSSNEPANILVKLTDFGLTRANPLFSTNNPSESSFMKRIPIRYAAPEILRDTSSNSYSEKSDVYSFGVLMWEICSYGDIPYEEFKTIEQVYDERLNGRQLQQPKNCSNQIWNIIRACFQEQSEKRPNFKIINEHLLNLRSENKRTSQYMNIDNCTLSNNNEKLSSNIPIYQNFNTLSNPQRTVQLTNENQSFCEYYTPCEYCLQSINDEDLESHKTTCSVIKLAKLFVKRFSRFPLIEIVSCKFCENLIPLNMIHIHERTCTNDMIYYNKNSSLSR